MVAALDRLILSVSAKGLRAVTLVALLAAPVWGAQHTIDPTKLVDLTYTFDAETVYWPTEKGFDLERGPFGVGKGGYFYSANRFETAEHGGTHVDAPIHFAEKGLPMDQVPLTSLVGPAVVVDVSAAAAEDPNYTLGVADLERWEKAHGRIPRGAIVVMRSGWGSRWPERKRYLGSDVPGDIAHLSFPGFSKEAATFLVRERDIAAIGVDTASIDPGRSTDFIVHQIINGANKPGLENIANADRLPEAGATIIALPMKIGGGSGAPARIVALLP